MTQNLGAADRAVRLILGILLTFLPLLTDFATGAPWLRWGSIVVGLVLLATTATRFCPLYALVGANTCRTRP